MLRARRMKTPAATRIGTATHLQMMTRRANVKRPDAAGAY
jgi:hypothetical protein